MSKESKRILDGLVLRDSKSKTGALLVERIKMHPKYKRRYKQTKKFLFHDEENRCKAGDKAAVIESRRLSKRKSWRLLSSANGN